MPEGLFLKFHQGANGLGSHLVASVLSQRYDFSFLFEEMRYGFPNHAHARPMVDGAIIGINSRALYDGFKSRRGASFHTSHPAREDFRCFFCVSLKRRQCLNHDGVMFAPAIPNRAPNVYSEHFKIGDQCIQCWNEAVCPASVQLVGKGGRRARHAVCEVQWAREVNRRSTLNFLTPLQRHNDPCQQFR